MAARRRALRRESGSLSTLWRIALIVAPLLIGVLALGIGRIPIGIGDVVKALTGGEVDKQTRVVVLTLRLPRVILAMLVGAGLSVAGCAFQTLFSNSLATPDTLGVASGASFGAALGLLLGFGLIGVQLTALAFGAAAVLLTGIAGFRSVRGEGGAILSGIMVGSLFSALVSLVKYMADTDSQLPAITYWLMGSLSGAGYPTLALGAPPILLGIATLLAIRWRLNILPLTDDEARASGVNVKGLRMVTVLSATAMTSSCVSMSGQVGWVGLLVPHMCRMLFGNNHLALIPASLSLGAVFMVLVDTLARSVSAAEIPVSILTALAGAPFFIYLMRRGKGGFSG